MLNWAAVVDNVLKDIADVKREGTSNNLSGAAPGQCCRACYYFRCFALVLFLLHAQRQRFVQGFAVSKT